MLINAVEINGGSINGNAGSGSTSAILVKSTIVSSRYYCTITGTADNTTDYVLPISSITTRFKGGEVSTITVVCPNGVDYASEILARSNGGIKISATEIYNDGSEDSSDWPEYAIDTIRSDKGARSFSVTLTGRGTRSYPFPKTLYLQGVSYIASQANGETTVRCDLDKDFNPGDTAILPDSTEIVIDAITHIITPTQRYMQLTG